MPVDRVRSSEGAQQRRTEALWTKVLTLEVWAFASVTDDFVTAPLSGGADRMAGVERFCTVRSLV
jgi:hypothetical protein